jgi:hypothetical protein
VQDEGRMTGDAVVEKEHAWTSHHPAKHPVRRDRRKGQYCRRSENTTPETSKFCVEVKVTIAALPGTIVGGEIVLNVTVDAITERGTKLL